MPGANTAASARQVPVAVAVANAPEDERPATEEEIVVPSRSPRRHAADGARRDGNGGDRGPRTSRGMSRDRVEPARGRGPERSAHSRTALVKTLAAIALVRRRPSVGMVLVATGRSGGMADAADSKSAGVNPREGSSPSFGTTIPWRSIRSAAVRERPSASCSAVFMPMMESGSERPTAFERSRSLVNERRRLLERHTPRNRIIEDLADLSCEVGGRRERLRFALDEVEDRGRSGRATALTLLRMTRPALLAVFTLERMPRALP
jgi:hypothetical protein